MAARGKKPAFNYRLPQGSVTRSLDVMALAGKREILRRAFPDNARAGKSSKGKTFKPLTAGYARSKAKKGRPPKPDQRLTSSTANALGVTRRTKNARVLGFRLNQVIAGYLQKRNQFWPLTRKEERRTLAHGTRAINKGLPKGVRVTKGRVIIESGAGKRLGLTSTRR